MGCEVSCSSDRNVKNEKLRQARLLGINKELHWATEAKDLVGVKKALRKGAEVNCLNFKGFSPLIIAASNGCLDIVKYLVGVHKADVNIMTCFGSTALQLSSTGGHLHVVQYLIEEAKMDVNVRNGYVVGDSGPAVNGETALLCAAYVGDIQLVKYLVGECNADVSLRSLENKTALEWSAFQAHDTVTDYLLEYIRKKYLKGLNRDVELLRMLFPSILQAATPNLPELHREFQSAGDCIKRDSRDDMTRV